jgi:Flp pilus assembly protein TadD
MKGNTAEGLPDINQVLERNPKNQMALIGRGFSLLTSGQTDRAIITLNQAIEGSTEDIGPRTLRARAYLLRNEADARSQLCAQLPAR